MTLLGAPAVSFLQFPFYAGIMGIMTGTVTEGGPSLAGVISNFFVAISNDVTFPLFTFLSAGIVNFFVPSGGGQWAVQAPIVLPATVKWVLTLQFPVWLLPGRCFGQTFFSHSGLCQLLVSQVLAQEISWDSVLLTLSYQVSSFVQCSL